MQMLEGNDHSWFDQKILFCMLSRELLPILFLDHHIFLKDYYHQSLVQTL